MSVRVEVRRPGSAVSVRVLEEKVAAYEARGWARVAPAPTPESAPAPKRKRAKGRPRVVDDA